MDDIKVIEGFRGAEARIIVDTMINVAVLSILLFLIKCSFHTVDMSKCTVLTWTKISLVISEMFKCLHHLISKIWNKFIFAQLNRVVKQSIVDYNRSIGYK